MQSNAEETDDQSTGLRHRLKPQHYNNDTIRPELLSPSSPRVYDFVEEISPLRQGGHELFKFENFNVLAYFQREMLGIGEPGHLEPEAVENIQNFLAIPAKLESLLCFGFFICLDAFLFVLTYLPVRTIFSLALLAGEAMNNFMSPKSDAKIKKRDILFKGVFFRRSNLYDLLRGALLLIGCAFLQWLDMSRVYHFIRGQTMIKLYVINFTMDIFDKLLASFGQDVFGSLYYRTRTTRGLLSKKFSILSMLKLFVVAIFYVALHSTVYFINIATLAVAINSSDRALLSVLILNNVTEIKSFVFKKFDKNKVFQLSCADITERFHIGLFLTCIAIGGIAQAGPMWFDSLRSHLLVFGMFIGAEMVSDSAKHAFIAKFNDIPAGIYEEFLKVLRNDILNSHKDKVILDQTYAISRRVGLSQIPLGCVFIRYFSMALMSPYWYEGIKQLSWINMMSRSVLVFGTALVVKTLLGVGLVLFSGRLHNIDLNSKINHSYDGDKSFGSTDSLNAEESLAEIDRFTAIEGRVVG